MDVIEKAIRSAFDKGTPDDRAFRERVYRQAFGALDRALQANPGSTVENAIARRKQLQATIVEIESEFIPAVYASAPSDPAFQGLDGEAGLGSPRIDMAADAQPRSRAPEVSPPETGSAGQASTPNGVLDPAIFGPPASSASHRFDTAGLRDEPEFSLDPSFAELPHHEPSATARTTDAPASPVAATAPVPAAHVQPPPVLPDVNVAAERVVPARRGSGRRTAAARQAAGGYDPRLRQRRGSFRGAVVIFLLLAMIGGGGWWAVRQGVVQLPIGRNTGEVRTQEQAPAEDFVPGEPGAPPPLRPAEADPERTWITVFEPADPTRVSAPADASAEVMQDESGSFLRIRSGKSGSAVAFDVGQGILEQLSGKKAVFDIIARAEGGGQSEMSVDCNFGELGDCGRKRYAVGYERGEYLFEVQFPAIDPGAGGTVAVNSDFAGQGRAIDIYELRVAAESSPQ